MGTLASGADGYSSMPASKDLSELHSHEVVKSFEMRRVGELLVLWASATSRHHDRRAGHPVLSRAGESRADSSSEPSWFTTSRAGPILFPHYRLRDGERFVLPDVLAIALPPVP